MEKSPADVLEEAADILLIHGRCIGYGQDQHGRLCVLGALTKAADGDPRFWGDLDLKPVARKAAMALARRVPYSACSEVPERIYRWNDRLSGDEGDFEVMDTLRLVAKDLRNEASS